MIRFKTLLAVALLSVTASPAFAQTMKVGYWTSGFSLGFGAVMEQMTNGKFRHVPVLDGGQLVGIISIGDVVKHRLKEMERDQEAMRDYIQTA